MKKVIFLLLTLTLYSCNNDDDSNTGNSIHYMKIEYKNEQTNYITYYYEFYFDSEGKVTSFHFSGLDPANDPDNSFVSTYEYNNEGKVIKEITDGQLYQSVNWTNNIAEVYNHLNQKTDEFIFFDDGTIERHYGLNISNGNITRKYYYDSNQNITHLENDTERIQEYWNYDLNKQNPVNLLKSIGIFRMWQHPYTKNIFYSRKEFPIDEEDHTIPLKIHEYEYTFDSENRVRTMKITNDIYNSIQEFTYQ
ncbi:hypothetical protein [Hanstruepera marina]|uniref:hypothetical protein n=1 Tax=Hanstruepera marina TaxID=2873265 RepID=UPI001CA658CD|nr:hypothetical protein [Hanstruepera marina]